jgi:hypothetical protein
MFRCQWLRLPVHPGKGDRDAMLTESAVDTHGAIARVIHQPIVGRQGYCVIESVRTMARTVEESSSSDSTWP